MAKTTRGTLAASRPAAVMGLTAGLATGLIANPTAKPATSPPTTAARLPVAAATLFIALGLQGCVSTNLSTNATTSMNTPGSPSQAYSGSAPAQPEQVIVRLGVVQNVKFIQISANGTLSGGFNANGAGSASGFAGGAVSAGQSSLVTGQVGSIAGAVAGNAIEDGVAIRDGLEIAVRLDNGELSAIDQQVTGETFQAGDRVRVLSGNGVTRVTH